MSNPEEPVVDEAGQLPAQSLSPDDLSYQRALAAGVHNAEAAVSAARSAWEFWAAYARTKYDLRDNELIMENGTIQRQMGRTPQGVAADVVMQEALARMRMRGDARVEDDEGCPLAPGLS